MTPLLVFFSLFFSFTIAQAGRIVVRPAGTGGRAIILSPNFSLCPTAFSSRGFTVACEPALVAERVTFYVNETRGRTETIAPFSIAGDNGVVYKPWYAPAGQIRIKCMAQSASGLYEVMHVRGRFTCGYNKQSLTPTVTTSTRTVMPINKKYCVGIPANSYHLPRPELWVPQSDGSLGYRLRNISLTPVEPMQASLHYSFTVPVKTRYAITLDSMAMGDVDYNDVWIMFPGITLRGYHKNTTRPSVYRNIHGPIKAYQNYVKRSKAAFSVDHNPHSFSTTHELLPGVEYNITLAARSTMFRLYGIILFPCDGADCVAGTRHWQTYLTTCSIWH